MAGNIFGNVLRLITFGESHGDLIGGVLEGYPAGIELDMEAIQHELDRRKPGQSHIVTQRKEQDKVRLLSGVFEGRTTGTPIGFVIENTDPKSADYAHIKDKFRPSHADYTYQQKYAIRDHRGGGRSSARETACRVVAGALAKQLIPQIRIQAYVSAVGEIQLDKHYTELDFANIELNPVRCPDLDLAQQMEEYIKQIRKEGDTIGGIVTCVVSHMPVGLGEPVFDRLSAELAKAMLSINAVKGFEYGSGFRGTTLKGSQHNDIWLSPNKTLTNHSGGIQGGISNGQDIYFRVAFKPVATIIKEQPTIDIQGNTTTIQGRGRHDPCVVPRAVPIVEAMTALVLADYFLLNRLSRK